jgi:hypothetical protein
LRPRRPSPELQARIFGIEPEPAAAISFDLRELTRWIVPAFGCFLLVMASLSSNFHPRYGIELAETNFVLRSLTEEGSPHLPPSATEHSLMNNIPARTL